MTTTVPGAATLSDRVSEEIRAMMARRRMSGRELARRLGVSPAWVSYRLTNSQPIDLNDLEQMAKALEVAPEDLLPRRAGWLPPGSPKRPPIDALAPRVVAVGGDKRRTDPVRATRTQRHAVPVRPLTPALV